VGQLWPKVEDWNIIGLPSTTMT